MTDPVDYAREALDSGYVARPMEVTKRPRTRRKPERSPRRVNLPVWGFVLALVGAGIVGVHLGLVGIVILALVLA